MSALVEQVADHRQIEDMKRAFHGVFRSTDPFVQPLQPDVVGRAILFPSWENFRDYEWEAMIIAAASVGDYHAYFSSVEGHLPFNAHLHFRVRLIEGSHGAVMERLFGYGYVPFVHSALYSPSGTWGALTSHNIHAVVGGPLQFVEELGFAYDLNAAVLSFLQSWKRNETVWQVDVSWAGQLVQHVFGEERGASTAERNAVSCP